MPHKTNQPPPGCNQLQQIYAHVGLSIPASLQNWQQTTAPWLDAYYDQTPSAQLLEIVLDSAVFVFDLTGMAKAPPQTMKLAMPVSPYPTFPRRREKGQTNRFASFTLMHERVVFAYAVSTPALTRRDGSRIKGFPNINASVKATLGNAAFIADKGHFLGHASGGQLDINLFPHRRELNRGWSAEGKVFRTLEKYVADNPGTFFYHRPIYDDDSWIPATLEYGVLKENKVWCVETFANKLAIWNAAA